MDKHAALYRYFGYTSFRGGQEPLIDAILGGRDAFGIMPTGGGKSICYQIPALLLEGLTVVVSPLISLMKDQVTALREAGIAAAYLNSTLTFEEGQAVFRELRQGSCKLLYVSPERLGTDGFRRLASTLPISLLAIDEAHCISQWGNDFRPAYLGIADFVARLPGRPILAAFTATATERVRADITEKLGLCDPVRIVTGFDRPNLYFEVLQPRSGKLDALLNLLATRRGVSGIIYCSTRHTVENVAAELTVRGYAATRYHAGLTDEERTQNQEDFVYDRKTVMVATNAFGMGIDKSNVSYVIHYNMPLSPEAYYQEAGRAGRDGSEADCILLFSAADIRTARHLISMNEPNSRLSEEEREESLRGDYERLDRMIAYCKTTDCLRGNLLSYFGEKHASFCNYCRNCHTQFERKDITVEAQKILSCIRRIEGKLGYSVGATLLQETLRGGTRSRLLSLGLQELSTYGIMAEHSRAELLDMIGYLESCGYIQTDSLYGGITLLPAARKLLFEGEKLVMAFKKAPKKTPASKPPSVKAPGGELYERLRLVRSAIADRDGVPPYVIFGNATLVDMTFKKPRTPAEFMTVSGVGEVKAKRYAKAFVDAINSYLEEKEEES